MKTKNVLITGIFLLAACLTACAPPDISANTYNTGQIGQAAPTTTGVIVSAMPVKVTNSSPGSNIGTIAGALAGGVAGSAIGGGARANILGGVGGALLGGYAGNYAQQRLSAQTGIQYTVRLRNHQLYTITQGMNPALDVGQRVLVIFSNPARIVANY